MLSEKKLNKIEKILGQEFLDEMDKLDINNLEMSIITAEHSIYEAIRELENNPKFLELKENLKVLSAGMKDVKKRQKAIIEYCLHLLEEKI